MGLSVINESTLNKKLDHSQDYLSFKVEPPKNKFQLVEVDFLKKECFYFGHEIFKVL